MIVAYLALIVLVGIGLVIQYFFLQEMRTRHPAVWETLGSPGIIVNNNRSTVLAVWRFLWRKEYAALGDREFARFATFVRAYLIAYLVVLALVTILSFAFALV